ncbi:hypothetical protein D3C77_568730 [compost metagenome]
MAEDPTQDRRVAQTSMAHYQAFFFLDLASHEHGNCSRHEGDGKNHCAKQRDHHGEGHRVEHLAFDTGEGKDRQVHHHNDQLTEDQRSSSFAGSGEHFMEPLSLSQ